MDLPTLAAFVGLLEGPFKWPIMVGVIVFIALFFTRFVFKTLKWILMAVGILLLAGLVINYLNR